MGIGIAIVFARGGCRTLLYDTDPKSIARAYESAASFLQKSVRLGKMQAGDSEAAIGRLIASPDKAALSDCDLVIEAVFEDEAIKRALLAELDEICPRDTLLASNTSTLAITGLGGATRYPERVVGLHFCLPAQLMKLVEVTRGYRTAPDVFDQAWKLCEAVGQIPVETQDTPGFILNHFAIPLHNRAIRMVELNVAKAEDIDRAVKSAYGHPMGPLELVDLVGLDTQERLCDAFYARTLDPELACPNLVRQMVAAGWLGRKSGRGFYHYQNTSTFGG